MFLEMEDSYMTELCTLNEFKTYKKIPIANDKEDAVISQQITQVSSFIKLYCGRTFVDYSVTPKVVYPKKFPIYVEEFPITSAIVEYSTDNGTTYTTLVEGTDYFIDYEEGILYFANPNTINLTGFKPIKLTYTGGDTEAPPEIKQACMDLVEYFRSEEYTPRKMFDKVQVENLGFREGGSGSELPKHIKRILEMYRIVY